MGTRSRSVDGLLERIASMSTLYDAWLRTRQKLTDDDPTATSWPKEARSIERRLESHLQHLSRLLRAGAWRPSPSQVVRIPKSDGTERVLQVPPIRDRIVERAIVSELVPLVDPLLGPWSYAYRRGRSVEDALSDLAWLRDGGLAWVARTDFDDCFDTVSHRLLVERLEAICPSEVISLVDLVLRRPGRERGVVGPPNRCGVPQGGPLSPMLANFHLDRFDEAMARRGVPLVRYGDDVTLLSSDRAGAEEALDAASVEADAIEMRLNVDKTRVTSFEDGFAFLGEDIGPVHPVHELHRIGEGDVLKKSLYVSMQGAGVRLDKGQIVVGRDGGELLRVPQSMVGQMILTGAVGLSAGARSMALYEKVPVTFLSRRGSYLGRLDAADRPRAALRRRQYRAGDRPSLRLELARGFVLGKIANQRTLLQRYTRRSSLPKLAGAANALRESYREAERAEDLPILLGVEGNAARCYFQALGELLPDEAGFTGRTRRPPKDPVNACLSYGYAVLVAEVTTAVSVVGLDPVAGFLHEDSERRPSLSLDVMEEFRPLIVDAVVLDLFRRRRLKASDHFRKERGAVLLDDDGRRILLAAYEERMLTVFSHVPSGKRVSYRKALTLQTQQIARVLEGAAERYEPVPWR